jgi:prophage regulatory protein
MKSVIRYPEVRDLTGFSRSTIWRFEKAGQFPKRIALGRNSVGWKAEEVAGWLDSRPRVAESAASPGGPSKQEGAC